jgi:hypothetical protein
MTKTTKLDKLGACDEAREWAEEFASLEEAWTACERPDWMVWWLGRAGVDVRDIVLLACAFARRVIHLSDAPDAEVALCAVEQWAHGDKTVTDEALRTAGSAAWEAVARTADSVALTADSVAARTAAVRAAWSAWSAAVGEARVTERRAQCDLIRRFWLVLPGGGQ